MNLASHVLADIPSLSVFISRFRRKFPIYPCKTPKERPKWTEPAMIHGGHKTATEADYYVIRQVCASHSDLICIKYAINMDRLCLQQCSKAS